MCINKGEEPYSKSFLKCENLLKIPAEVGTLREDFDLSSADR